MEENSLFCFQMCWGPTENNKSPSKLTVGDTNGTWQMKGSEKMEKVDGL